MVWHKLRPVQGDSRDWLAKLRREERPRDVGCRRGKPGQKAQVAGRLRGEEAGDVCERSVSAKVHVIPWPLHTIVPGRAGCEMLRALLSSKVLGFAWPLTLPHVSNFHGFFTTFCLPQSNPGFIGKLHMKELSFSQE